MNYMKIVEADTKSGIGYRVTIFVSGCSVHPHCDKCFNKEAWSFHSGKSFTEDTKKEILYYLSKPYISGFSILGGDCISNVKKDDTLLDLVKTIKNIYPNKTIYAWTGFSYEQIIIDENIGLVPEDETYVCIPERPDSEYEFLRKTQFWTTKKLIEQIEKDASDYSGFFGF